MKRRVYRGEWAGCSNFREKREELNKAHEEFTKMVADGWQLSIKPRRPRIKKPKTPREVEVLIFGDKVRMSFAEYQQRGQGFKVIMEIF